MNKVLSCGSVFFSILLIWAAPALAGPMEIVVSIPPQKWLADRLGGTFVTTHVLVGKGQDPHTFQPTPKLLLSLSRAALYFAMDMEFERVITDKLKQSASSLQIVDTTASIRKIPISGHTPTPRHENESPHRHGTLDPHVWLSPPNLKLMARSMADAMAGYDPANRALYEQNLNLVSTMLDELHRHNQQLLAPYAGESFFVFHPAFGYFAHIYQLHQEAVEADGKAPTPKQLSTLISRARADNIKVIFVQPQFDGKSAAAVAGAIGGRVVALDPLAEDVVTNLTLMAENIASALANR